MLRLINRIARYALTCAALDSARPVNAAHLHQANEVWRLRTSLCLHLLDKLSDEAATHIAEHLHDFAVAFDNQHFARVRRDCDDPGQMPPPGMRPLTAASSTASVVISDRDGA